MRQPLVAITSDVRTFENYTWHAAPDQYLTAVHRCGRRDPFDRSVLW